MKPVLHALAGGIALLAVALFFSATVIAELVLSPVAVAMVKSAIVGGLFVLIPAVVIAGGSGFSLSRGRSEALASSKKHRWCYSCWSWSRATPSLASISRACAG